MSVLGFMHMSISCPWRLEESIGSSGMELQVVVSCVMWVLGTGLWVLCMSSPLLITSQSLTHFCSSRVLDDYHPDISSSVGFSSLSFTHQHNRIESVSDCSLYNHVAKYSFQVNWGLADDITIISFYFKAGDVCIRLYVHHLLDVASQKSYISSLGHFPS